MAFPEFGESSFSILRLKIYLLPFPVGLMGSIAGNVLVSDNCEPGHVPLPNKKGEPG